MTNRWHSVLVTTVLLPFASPSTSSLSVNQHALLHVHVSMTTPSSSSSSSSSSTPHGFVVTLDEVVSTNATALHWEQALLRDNVSFVVPAVPPRVWVVSLCRKDQVQTRRLVTTTHPGVHHVSLQATAAPSVSSNHPQWSVTSSHMMLLLPLLCLSILLCFSESWTSRRTNHRRQVYHHHQEHDETEDDEPEEHHSQDEHYYYQDEETVSNHDSSDAWSDSDSDPPVPPVWGDDSQLPEAVQNLQQPLPPAPFLSRRLLRPPPLTVPRELLDLVQEGILTDDDFRKLLRHMAHVEDDDDDDAAEPDEYQQDCLSGPHETTLMHTSHDNEQQHKESHDESDQENMQHEARYDFQAQQNETLVETALQTTRVEGTVLIQKDGTLDDQHATDDKVVRHTGDEEKPRASVEDVEEETVGEPNVWPIAAQDFNANKPTVDSGTTTEVPLQSDGMLKKEALVEDVGRKNKTIHLWHEQSNQDGLDNETFVVHDGIKNDETSKLLQEESDRNGGNKEYIDPQNDIKWDHAAQVEPHEIDAQVDCQHQYAWPETHNDKCLKSSVPETASNDSEASKELDISSDETGAAPVEKVDPLRASAPISQASVYELPTPSFPPGEKQENWLQRLQSRSKGDTRISPSTDDFSYVSTLPPDSDGSSTFRTDASLQESDKTVLFIDGHRKEDQREPDPFEFTLGTTETTELCQKAPILESVAKRRNRKRQRRDSFEASPRPPKSFGVKMRSATRHTGVAIADDWNDQVFIWEPTESELLNLSQPTNRKKRRSATSAIVPENIPSLEIIAQSVSAPVWKYDDQDATAKPSTGRKAASKAQKGIR